MIRALIIDDEPKSIKVLSTMLREYCPGVTQVGEARRADEAVMLVRQLRPNLVFLDIEMPSGNGFEILDRLRPVQFELVFVTAFNEYTLKAFRYNALDYLLKPLNIEELQTAVDKAAENIRLKSFNTQLDKFLENLKQVGPAVQKIALPEKNGIILVPVTDIIRCEASRGYTTFILKNRQRVLSSKNIKEYEDLLPEHTFFRLHHSHLVNLNYIRMYHRGRGGQVEMEDGTLVEVAVRRKDELLARLGLVREG